MRSRCRHRPLGVERGAREGQHVLGDVGWYFICTVGVSMFAAAVNLSYTWYNIRPGTAVHA